MTLAREAQMLLAWDAGHVLYLLDRGGNLQNRWASPHPLQAAAISDDGQWIAALAADGRVFWFDAAGQNARFVRGPGNPLSVAIDSQGWYILASSARGDNLVLDRRGKKVSGFRSPRPLKYTTFLPESPLILGAAEQGFLSAMTIYGRTIWKTLVAAGLSGLAADARGRLVIASATQQGLLRFTSAGAQKDAYPGEQPTSVSLSAIGDLLLYGTLSQQVMLLRKGKQVVWRQDLGSKIVQVQLDPLGRRGYVGLESGRIMRIDFQDQPGKTAPVGEARTSPRPAATAAPAWSVSLKVMADTLSGVSLKVLDNPKRIAVLQPNQTIAIYSGEPGSAPADPLHVTAVLEGKGRVLHAGEGLLIGLSDRKCVVYDAARNHSAVYPTRFTEITHSRLYNATELILVQERDRLTRATLSGEVAWVEPLRDCVQEMAIAGRTIAVMTDRGELILYTPSGEILRRMPPASGGAQLLAATDEQFVTAGSDQTLRCYSPFGELLWERSSPIEPWQLLGVGRRALLRGLSGETIAISSNGKLTPGKQPQVVDETYFTLPSGRLARVFPQQRKLSCLAFSGEQLWGHMLEDELGPMTASTAGIAAIIGSRLCWFPAAETKQQHPARP